MSWPFGLLRLWAIASAIWLIGWTLFVRQRCHSNPDGSYLCMYDGRALQGGQGEIVSWGPLELYLLGFAVPAAVLVLGVIVVWFVRRSAR
jgi:hypothetical protein